MAIVKVKSLKTYRTDVKYEFSDGVKLIHDSGRYYIRKKAWENEVRIKSYGDDISYQFVNRGREPATTIEDTEYYTHPYGGRTAIPRTGIPSLG